MAIKYKDFEKREQLRKDYIDKAAEAAKTQANEYTDEKIKNIVIPTPDIPTALPQKYEAFKVQFPQGKWGTYLNKTAAWEEFHKTLWSGSEILTTSSSEAHFITDTVLDYPAERKYSLLVTVGGAEKELKPTTNGYACTENGTVTLNARVVTESNSKTYDNTSIVYIYCPSGSPYIGQTMTAAHYGKKQYLYQLTEGEVVLQEPTETEKERFFTMLQSIATKNAKLKITLTDNIIEANYVNISKELVTTVYTEDTISLKYIGLVADRIPNKVQTYITDDMPTCIKGILEVEYTDEEATKECIYDKIQGESYTFKIGDFNHAESSAFDYYFNGAALIPWDNAQLQAVFTYRLVSGTEKTITAKSLINNGQMIPYFDISELFGQAANTVMALLISNRAIENEAMGGRPVTTVTLTSNVQNFTDANDEIMISQILTLMPENLPQTYKKKAVTLATNGWVAHSSDLSKIWRTEFTADGFEANVFDKTYNIKAGDAIVYSINGNQTSQTVNYNEQGKYWYVPLPTYGSKLQYIQFNAVPTAVNVFVASATSSSVKVVSGYVQSLIIISIGGVQVTDSVIQSLTDTDVKVNSEIRFVLDEANGKLAGQFGLKKTIDKETGKLTFTADTLPTSAITGTLEIGDTSTEGAAFVEGITSETDTTGFVKATEENTFTKTQTFNGTESQAGIKTNAIDNENGNRVVYFNGEKQMFGSGAIPSQVRTSEQRLKLERPVSGGTGTEIVEVANLSDVSNVIVRKTISIPNSSVQNVGDTVTFDFGTKNYANILNSSSNPNEIRPVMATIRGAARLQEGIKYSVRYYDGSAWTETDATCSLTIISTIKVPKLECTVNGKTLIIVDRLMAESNITSENDLVYRGISAVAYFSDFSSPGNGHKVELSTCPLQRSISIPYDDDILVSSDITIEAPNVSAVKPYVNRTSNSIELIYGVGHDISASSTGFVKGRGLIPYYIDIVVNRKTTSASVGKTTLVGFDDYKYAQAETFIAYISDWIQDGNYWRYSTFVNAVWNDEVEVELETSSDVNVFSGNDIKVKEPTNIFYPKAVQLFSRTKPTTTIAGTIYVYQTAR